MKYYHYLICSLLLLAFAGTAEAALTQAGSHTQVEDTATSTVYQIGLGPTVTTNHIIIGGGNPYTLYCHGETAFPPNSIEIRLVSADVPLSSSPSAIRTISLTPTQIADCTGVINPQTTFIDNAYCTLNGQSGGGLAFGSVRLWVRIQRTTPPTYDVISDTAANGLAGHMNCAANINSFVENSPPSIYVGGDTISVSTVTDETPYSFGLHSQTNAICGGTELIEEESPFNVHTVVIKGGLSRWANLCDLSYETKTLPLITSVGNMPQVALNGTLTLDTAKTVDRRLTPDSVNCPLTHLNIAMHPPTNVANRGQSIETHCAFKNARGDHVTNNKLGRAWITINTTHNRDTSAASATDFLFTSQGQAASSHSLLSSAPVGYYAMTVESYGSSRADAELHNYGAGFKAFNISATYRFTNWTYAKNDPNSTTNVSVFQIGADTGYLTPRALHNAAGYPVSGVSVSCSRFRPMGELDITRSHGTTDSNGDASQVQWDPAAPRGTWTIICNGSSNGNSIDSGISVEYTSTFTADTAVIINYRIDKTVINVTTTFRQYDGLNHNITFLIPDGNVTLWLEVEQPPNTFPLYPVVYHTQMIRACPTCSAYYGEIPIDIIPEEGRVQVYSHANVTGSPFLGHAQIIGESSMLPTELSVSLAIFGILGTGAYLSLSNNNVIGSLLAVIGGLIASISAVTFEAEMLSEVFYTIMLASLAVMMLFGWRIYLQIAGGAKNV